MRYYTRIDNTGPMIERFETSDIDGNYALVFNHILEEGASSKYYSDLEKYLANTNSLQFANSKPSTKVKVGRGPQILQRGGERTIEYRIAEMITEFLVNIKIFQASRRPNPQAPSGEHYSLQENGSNLVNVMNTLQTTKPKEFVRIMNQLPSIVTGITEVTAPPVGSNVTIRMEEEGLTSQIDLVNMSIGLQQTLILLIAMETAQPNQTICIEEPEMNIHSTSQKVLFDLMRKKAEHNQFFITTHSSIFTAIGEDAATYLVTKVNGKSQAIPIVENNDLKLIKQQLGIRNSDIYGNDYVIFIEGDSEEDALPIIAHVLGYDHFGKSIRIINLEGNGKIVRLKQLLSYLKGSDTVAFLILDGDGDIRKHVDDLVREGLLEKDHVTIWEEGEFEDIFENQRIVDAMNRIAKRDGFTFGITVEQLEKERKSRNVTDILGDYMHNTNKIDLGKRDLARELAYSIVEEIREGNSRKKTRFEETIEKIMQVATATK